MGAATQAHTLLTTTLADAAAGQTIDVGYPTGDQSTLISPTSVAAQRHVAPRSACSS